MSEYNKILGQFTKLNFNQSSELKQHEIDKALDTIGYSNTGITEFDRQVSEELWEHTPKHSSNTVILRDYVHSIVQAQKILKDQMRTIEDQLKYTKDEHRKQQLMGDLYSYSQDHRILTAPFNIEQIKETALMQQSRASQNPSNARMRESSGIFDHMPSQSTNSWSLKIALLLTFILIIVQLILTFHKHHFYSLLCYCFVLAIFFLNYFDRLYMKFVIINLLLSVVLDLVWLIAMSDHYWNANAQTQHSTLQGGFLKLIILLIVIMMVGKIILIILFFRYRDNSEDLRKSVELFNLKFNLDGKPQNNPVTSILSGTRH